MRECYDETLYFWVAWLTRAVSVFLRGEGVMLPTFWRLRNIILDNSASVGQSVIDMLPNNPSSLWLCYCHNLKQRKFFHSFFTLPYHHHHGIDKHCFCFKDEKLLNSTFINLYLSPLYDDKLPWLIELLRCEFKV